MSRSPRVSRHRPDRPRLRRARASGPPHPGGCGQYRDPPQRDAPREGGGARDGPRQRDHGLASAQPHRVVQRRAVRGRQRGPTAAHGDPRPAHRDWRKAPAQDRQRSGFEHAAGDARQAIEAATIALRAAVGPDALADSFDVVGELDYRDVPLERDELRRLALANRPDLQAARAARDKARADVNLARANAWWDVTPQIEYQRIGP